MKTAAYLRVSTLDQAKGIKSQEDAITAYIEGHGLKAKRYRDRISGANTNRPAFKRLQRDIFLGRVDCVICWKLDRLSRSLRDGVNLLHEWLDKGVRVVSVSEQIDFGGSGGQLIASVLFAVASMERETLRENTKRGLAAARSRGEKLGRPCKVETEAVLDLLGKGFSKSQAARELRVSRQTIYDALRRK